MDNLDSKKLADRFNLDAFEESITDANEALSGGCCSAPSAAGSLDMQQIFAELTKLVKNGNDVLENVKYVLRDNPDDGELVAATAALLGAIRDTLKEFTSIYKMTLKHNQNLEIEKIKISGKRDLLDTKIKETRELLMLRNKDLLNGSQPQSLLIGSEEMVPFCQEDIIKTISMEEKKNNRQSTTKSVSA